MQYSYCFHQGNPLKKKSQPIKSLGQVNSFAGSLQKASRYRYVLEPLPKLLENRYLKKSQRQNKMVFQNRVLPLSIDSLKFSQNQTVHPRSDFEVCKMGQPCDFKEEPNPGFFPRGNLQQPRLLLSTKRGTWRLCS